MGSPCGGGDVVDDVLQHRLDVDAHLGGDLRRVHRRRRPMMFSISSLTRAGSAAGRSILLITGQDLQVVLQGQVGVGQGLGLHALGGVHHQDGALAGGQGAGDLIVEVHVARGVDEVEGIGLAVLGLIVGWSRPGP